MLSGQSSLFYAISRLPQKNPPLKDDGNLMFSQRNNPYCDLLENYVANLQIYVYKRKTFSDFLLFLQKHMTKTSFISILHGKEEHFGS